MNFKDFFDINEALFNPSTFCEGEFLISPIVDNEQEDLLLMNSLEQNGINLYQKYLNENYLKGLKNQLGFDTPHVLPNIFFCKDQKTDKKTVTFYYYTYLMERINLLYLVDKEKKADFIHSLGTDDMFKNFKKLLNEEQSKLISLKNNLKNPNYKDSLIKVQRAYTSYLNNLRAILPNELAYLNRAIPSIDKFISNRINEIKVENKTLERVYNFFTKRIDTDSLIDCFDFDKFALLVAYCSIVQCKNTIENEGLVDYCLIYCEYYVMALYNYRKHLEETTGEIYNPKVKIQSKPEKRINADYIIEEFRKIKLEHPEYSAIDISDIDLDELLTSANKSKYLASEVDLSTERGSKLFDEALQTLLNQKALKASWRIIPKGSIKGKSKKILNKIHTEITDAEAARRVEYSYKFFEHNAASEDKTARRSKINYLYSLQGKGGFEGYTAYIYPTGKVVFEIYFEDEISFKPVKYHATYLTNIESFIELSKYSKNEVAHKLKKDPSLGRRIYHRKDMDKWALELDNGINSIDYTNDVINYIQDLVKSGTLVSPQLVMNKGTKK